MLQTTRSCHGVSDVHPDISSISFLQRGVSGGERKRTNIATEIVSNPALVFLDEPTSGLDAATSLGLIVSLKMLAKSGHTVVTTIHQPSSAMFMMFDKVILLAEGGWMVYSGPAREVLNYFSTLGLHAPSSYNPADFMRTHPLAPLCDGLVDVLILVRSFSRSRDVNRKAEGRPLSEAAAD